MKLFPLQVTWVACFLAGVYGRGVADKVEIYRMLIPIREYFSC